MWILISSSSQLNPQAGESVIFEKDLKEVKEGAMWLSREDHSRQILKWKDPGNRGGLELGGQGILSAFKDLKEPVWPSDTTEGKSLKCNSVEGVEK